MFSSSEERRAEAQLSGLTLHEGLASAARRLAQRQRVGERQAGPASPTGAEDPVVIVSLKNIHWSMDWFKGKSTGNQETIDFPIKYGVFL